MDEQSRALALFCAAEGITLTYRRRDPRVSVAEFVDGVSGDVEAAGHKADGSRPLVVATRDPATLRRTDSPFGSHTVVVFVLTRIGVSAVVAAESKLAPVRLLIQKEQLSAGPCECCVCLEEQGAGCCGMQCPTCMDVTCSSCVPRIMSHSKDWSLVCPNCRARLGVEDALSNMRRCDRRSWATVDAAIQDVILEAGPAVATLLLPGLCVRRAVADIRAGSLTYLCHDRDFVRDTRDPSAKFLVRPMSGGPGTYIERSWDRRLVEMAGLYPAYAVLADRVVDRN